MPPEISVLLSRVLDNIRLAASPRNASVASLPRASPLTASSKPRVWQELGRLIPSVYFEQFEFTVRGSYFCVLMNPQTSFTALLSICVVVANTACPPGLNIVNL